MKEGRVYLFDCGFKLQKFEIVWGWLGCEFRFKLFFLINQLSFINNNHHLY